MSLYESYKTAAPKEKEGVWVSFKGGVRLLMARAGGANNKYRESLRRRMLPHQRALRTGEEIEEAVANKVMAEAYADAIILDWEGVTDENKQPLECTKENVVKVFTDLPDFFTLVREDAQNRAHFLAADEAADAKN